MTTDRTLRYLPPSLRPSGGRHGAGVFRNGTGHRRGSRVHGVALLEVRDAILANPYQRVWGGAGEPPLTVYNVNLPGVLRGNYAIRPATLFSSSGRAGCRREVRSALGHRSQRLPEDHSSKRHMPDWFVGNLRTNALLRLFPEGQSSLVVGRYSTCCKETHRGHERSLSLAGKLFPTTDPSHSEPLRRQILLRRRTSAATAPITSMMLNCAMLPIPPVGVAALGCRCCLSKRYLGKIDKEPTQRQLYQIAELGKPDGEPTRAPAFMRLLVDPAKPRIPGEGLDFREEIMAANIMTGGTLSPNGH